MGAGPPAALSPPRQHRGSGANAHPAPQARQGLAGARHRWGTGGGGLYLGHACLRGFLFQKGQGRFHVALSGCDVQWRVPRSGGQVGVGIIFQEELHDVRMANASCTVKWGLVILEPGVKKKNREY